MFVSPKAVTHAKQGGHKPSSQALGPGA
jgi:hypothetical protein